MLSHHRTLTFPPSPYAQPVRSARHCTPHEGGFTAVQPRQGHPAAAQPPALSGAPLPNFSAFHDAFSGGAEPATREGDIRTAFFAAYDDELCDYLHPQEISRRVQRGEPVVSATFVTPYPPGFPVLVPGQCFSAEILEFMSSLDTPEVHGYRPGLGYRVLTEQALHPQTGRALHSQTDRAASQSE